MPTIGGMKLRTCAPNGDWRSFIIASADGAKTEGDMEQIQDTVGMFMQDADDEEQVAFLYHAEKLLAPKVAGTGLSVSQGQKLYFDTVNAALTPTAGAYEWCAIALEDADADDEEVLVDLKGDKSNN